MLFQPFFLLLISLIAAYEVPFLRPSSLANPPTTLRPSNNLLNQFRELVFNSNSNFAPNLESPGNLKSTSSLVLKNSRRKRRGFLLHAVRSYDAIPDSAKTLADYQGVLNACMRLGDWEGCRDRFDVARQPQPAAADLEIMVVVDEEASLAPAITNSAVFSVVKACVKSSRSRRHFDFDDNDLTFASDIITQTACGKFDNVVLEPHLITALSSAYLSRIKLSSNSNNKHDFYFDEITRLTNFLSRPSTFTKELNVKDAFKSCSNIASESILIEAGLLDKRKKVGLVVLERLKKLESCEGGEIGSRGVHNIVGRSSSRVRRRRRRRL